jgi:hypothetical protein
MHFGAPAVQVLNRLGPRLEQLTAPGGGAAERQVVRVGAGAAAEDFVSSKLSSKLSRQLQDVLTLCSGGLPSWCRELTVTCPFLFPFDARQQYFFCTAFGLSRALQRLQQQQQVHIAHTAVGRALHIRHTAAGRALHVRHAAAGRALHIRHTARVGRLSVDAIAADCCCCSTYCRLPPLATVDWSVRRASCAWGGCSGRRCACRARASWTAR